MSSAPWGAVSECCVVEEAPSFSAADRIKCYRGYALKARGRAPVAPKDNRQFYLDLSAQWEAPAAFVENGPEPSPPWFPV